MQRVQMLFIFIFVFSIALFAQEENVNPLQPLEKLVGGKWHTEGSYQTFEWGVGKLSIIGKGFTSSREGGKLVSEGAWYYHPGDERVKGFFTAVEMPVEFFDYTSTTFEENKIMSDIIAYSKNGAGSKFYEEFEFTGDAEYVWRLFVVQGENKSKMMESIYKRK